MKNSMKNKIIKRQYGGVNLAEIFFVYILASMTILFSAHRFGEWSAVRGAITVLIAFPIVLILSIISYSNLSLFFSNQKYKKSIAKILANYPHGKVRQISTGTWEIISKSTEEPIAKIFLKSTGEITSVNLKSKK